MEGVSVIETTVDREDALNLGRASLDLQQRERLKVTQRLLSNLSGSSAAGLSLNLEELREQSRSTQSLENIFLELTEK